MSMTNNILRLVEVVLIKRTFRIKTIFLYQMMMSFNWTWLQFSLPLLSDPVHSGRSSPLNPNYKNYPEIEWNGSNQLSSLFYSVRLNLEIFYFS